jgi:signal-transduction protein with cAMP-binding, CBS, and nucleotidyltransferase domain
METTYKIAKDIMTKPLAFVDGLDTIHEAIQQMKTAKVDALIVNRRDAKDAYAIITVNDIIKKIYNKDLNPKEVYVYEIMTKPVITIPAEMNIRYIPRLFLRAKIQLAPVEENGEYLGMISYSSLIHKGIY